MCVCVCVQLEESSLMVCVRSECAHLPVTPPHLCNHISLRINSPCFEAISVVSVENDTRCVFVCVNIYVYVCVFVRERE